MVSKTQKEESGLMAIENSKEEIETGSGSEQPEYKSGNEQETSQQPPKKKRYHRHTAHQIQEMEAYVKQLHLICFLGFSFNVIVLIKFVLQVV